MSQPTSAPPLIGRRLFPRLRKPVIVRAPDQHAPRERVLVARAGRSLAWGAAVLVLVTAGFSASLETVLPQVRDPEYGYRLMRLRAQQRAHPNRPLVLVLGTSRTQNVIDPGAMGFADEPGSPLVYNFGRAGASPLHIRLALQRLHSDGVRPTAVLVEIMPTTLLPNAPGDSVFRGQTARLTAADLRRAEPYLDDPTALQRRWLWTRLDPWSAHRLALLSHLSPQSQPWRERVDFLWTMTDGSGFCQYPVITDEDRAVRRNRASSALREAIRNLQVSEFAERCFRDIVTDCHAAGIPVAFYFAPESPVFRSWYSPEALAALTAFERVLRDELGCPVFDAPTDYAEEDFADGHHALRPTAARFSQWLARRHLKPWLENGR